MTFDPTDTFQPRHIGPRTRDLEHMLDVVGAASLDELVDQAIPESIRLDGALDLPAAESESQFLERLADTATRNFGYRSFIGLGYYGTHTPSVILRNVFENPGWYTPYTPYQAEVAQGRLEALLNFQTVVQDLTAMEVANASVLDEATAAAEAMSMLHRIRARRPGTADRFVVSAGCFPQTIDVVRGRAEPLGIEVVVADISEIVTTVNDETIGVLVQYPDADGSVHSIADVVGHAHAAGAMVAVATDLLALTLLRPPGEDGVDVVVGNSQRFGVPMGYGGPHAAFFATREKYVRQIPGRVIGVSVDAQGNQAYRMALQTREQHIRRERATSNICTAQALLANIAGLYAVYHGPDGLTRIARRVHDLTTLLDKRLRALDVSQGNEAFFDTLRVSVSSVETAEIREAAEAARLNFRYFPDGDIGLSLDETTTEADVDAIVGVFAGVLETAVTQATVEPSELPEALRRPSEFLTHPVFNCHHSESGMMRYLKQLERKDLGLDTSMIPLGSCTMKLNAATEMRPVTWPEFSAVHPFVPPEQTAGYQEVFADLEQSLRVITGLAAVSLQPNSGAQGEFAGLLVIRAYHQEQSAQGRDARDVVLIPSSAHGTNPASAAMAGMRIVIVACDKHGNVDVEDLRAKAAEHHDRLAALMVTYPSTHGVFEDAITEICEIVHEHGGQVYMDGANMNAQVGLTSPAAIGADVCHINLHKTFAIPHGGGGPGMGPIAVASHLAPYLPGHPVVSTGGPNAIPSISAAPWGSASILLISYAYIRMLGGEGLTEATRIAILNANYVKARLEHHFDVLYTRRNGRVGHELIFDLRPFKAVVDVTEEDVAKRLIDYGFHAPTVSFPVAGTLMVEPTESEPREELDRFCDAMIQIRREIQQVLDGSADPRDNVLKNAPHTAEVVTANDWSHPYTREDAAFPLPFVRANKYWPPVGRVNNTHGDRNLVCACPPIEMYAEDQPLTSSSKP